MNEHLPDVGPGEMPANRGSRADVPRGPWWWLRVLEVRLRFVVLVLAALLVVTQWNRLRGLWDDWRHALHGTTAPASVSADLEYFCPMDPGVISVWPAVCPICNMDLVQRRKHDAQLLPEGVVARMQFSPYRVQLAGIRTAIVEPRPLDYEIMLSGVLHRGGYEDAVAAQREESEPEQQSALSFEAAISRNDLGLFAEPREALVFEPGVDRAPMPGMAELASSRRAETMEPAADAPRVRVTLAGDARRFSAGMSVRVIVRVPAGEVLAETGIAPIAVETAESAAAAVSIPEGTNSDPLSLAVLAVPESAVVDHGRHRFVFIESMPGTFDAVEVSLGRRCGDHYPVLRGLQAGQRVAVAGAFLIDAESRLNPSLAVSYFGANQSGTERRQPQVRLASPERAGRAPRLSPEEQALAARQGTCPVTGLSLDAMGGPVPLIVQGRKVFLCCQGCERQLKSDPEEYLAKLRRPEVPTDD